MLQQHLCQFLNLLIRIFKPQKKYRIKSKDLVLYIKRNEIYLVWLIEE